MITLISKSRWLASTLLITALSCVAGTAVCAEARKESLALEFACRVSKSTGTVVLRATVRNTGTTDTAVVMGHIVGNGRKYLADALALEAKSATGSAVQEFEYSDPTVAAIAGRLDPWIVALPPAASFTAEYPLNHFWSRGKSLRDSAQPMKVQLRFKSRAPAYTSRDMAGLSLLEVFIGDLRSNSLQIPGECAKG